MRRSVATGYTPLNRIVSLQKKMAVRLQGQLRWTDYLRAQYLHMRPRPSFAVVGVLLLLVFGWALFDATSLWMTGVNSWILPFLLVACLLFFAINFSVFIPIGSYRIFKQQKSLNAPFSIDATSEGFSFFNKFGSLSMPWDSLVKWKENRKLLLLYHSDALFNLVPKRMFEENAQLKEFQSFLAGVRRVR